jgi:nitroreductase
MDIQDAILARHSVRDFLSTPVPKDIIMNIMAAATRSPRRPIQEVVRHKS